MITLKTLKDATEQEVFDQAVNHLLTQNEESVDDGMCAYRGVGGAKCAAGCFISDEEYDFSFEGNPWWALVVEYSIPAYHNQLLTKLQNIHDRYSINEWKPALIDLAEQRGLTFNWK